MKVLNTSSSFLKIAGIKTKNIQIGRTDLSAFTNAVQTQDEELRKEVHIR
jgi:hypothetical protein